MILVNEGRYLAKGRKSIFSIKRSQTGLWAPRRVRPRRWRPARTWRLTSGLTPSKPGHLPSHKTKRNQRNDL